MQFKTCLGSSGVGSAPGNALNPLGPNSDIARSKESHGEAGTSVDRSARLETPFRRGADPSHYLRGDCVAAAADTASLRGTLPFDVLGCACRADISAHRS